jgi:hypothetical protein
MTIRCRECEATNLPHDEHCTPAELAALRQLVDDDNERSKARPWPSAIASVFSTVINLPDEDVPYG